MILRSMSLPEQILPDSAGDADQRVIEVLEEVMVLIQRKIEQAKQRLNQIGEDRDK